MREMRETSTTSELKTLKSVYCYICPEVWPLLNEVHNAIPRSMYMVTTPVEEVRRALNPVFYPTLEIPATSEGYVNLDEIHVPIIERIKRILGVYSRSVRGLAGFRYAYPTPGSSEGIFKLLIQNKVDGPGEINVLNGEYEGYGEYAGPDDLKMKVNHVAIEDAVKNKAGAWFISEPSARDGNILPANFINELCDAGNNLVVDLSYVGATRPHQFDVSHENISAVLLSLSKPYGVFRFRIGFTLTREPLHSLHGNKWFKDPERLLQGLKLVEELGPTDNGSTRLYAKYRPVQEQIVREINQEHGLGMRASDSFLLAYLTEEDAARLNSRQLALIEPFKRGNGYRFCLTPYFEEKERRANGERKVNSK